MIRLTAFCVALTLLATNIDAQSNEVAINLKKLCNDQPVDLNRVSQLIDIIELLETGYQEPKCNSDTTEAILDIFTLITEHKDDVCSMSKVDQIRDYHLEYVVDNNKRKSLPKALRNFFISYGLKIDSICKKNMINSLVLDTTSTLTLEDYSILNSWTNDENSLLNEINGGPADYGDLLSMKGFANAEMPLFDEKENSEKLLVKKATSNLLKQIQSVCELRFKPFYERLILPLVRLSNLGYDYQGEELERELVEFRQNIRVQQWYKITYLCESFKDIELVQDHCKKTSRIGRIPVSVHSKKETAISSFEQKQQVKDLSGKLSKIVYKPELGSSIGDLVINYEDEDLIKCLKKFNAGRSEFERITSGFFSRVHSSVKDATTKSKSNVSFNDDKNSDTCGSRAPKRELIRYLDEYVSKSSTPLSLAQIIRAKSQIKERNDISILED